jgi:hypothetical protein
MVARNQEGTACLPDEARCRVLTLKCESCGSYNDDTATECYFCKKQLPLSAERAKQIKRLPKNSSYATLLRSSSQYERPGCISCLALLYLVPGAIGVLFAVALLAFSFVDPAIARQITASSSLQKINASGAETPFTFILILSSIMCFAYFLMALIGWGLWTMRNWARILLMFILVVSILGGIINVLVTMLSTQGDTTLMLISIIPIVINFLLFTWFMWNRQRFR